MAALLTANCLAPDTFTRLFTAALSVLEEVARTSPNPAERRRAATAILRYLFARTPKPDRPTPTSPTPITPTTPSAASPLKLGRPDYPHAPRRAATAPPPFHPSARTPVHLRTTPGHPSTRHPARPPRADHDFTPPRRRPPRRLRGVSLTHQPTPSNISLFVDPLLALRPLALRSPTPLPTPPPRRLTPPLVCSCCPHLTTSPLPTLTICSTTCHLHLSPHTLPPRHLAESARPHYALGVTARTRQPQRPPGGRVATVSPVHAARASDGFGKHGC